MNLTVDRARKISGQKERDLKVLNASHKDIEHVHDLSSCVKVEKIDLSHNSLANFKGIKDCYTLSWLNISHNQIESLAAACKLRNLKVLNASHNKVSKCGDLSRLTNLRALILNNNELSVIPGLHKLVQLNTLVLSHNSFEAVDISSLPQLTKLSVAHNSLESIPDTSCNCELLELRLNGNSISKLSPCLRSNTRLKVLDLGNNRFKKLKSIQVLKDLKNLRNLNMRGNPLYNEQDDELRTEVQQLASPNLEVFDSIKVSSVRPKTDVKIKKSSEISFKPKPSFNITGTHHDVSTPSSNQLLAEPTLSAVSSKDEEYDKAAEPGRSTKGRVHFNIDNSNSEMDKDSNAGVDDNNSGLVLPRTSDVAKQIHRKRPRGKSGVVGIVNCSKKKKEMNKDALMCVAMTTNATVGVGGASSWD